MKSSFLTTITLLGLASCSIAQTQLKGEYRHAKRNQFYSIFNFHDDNFTLIQVGDLGRFFGKGKYDLKSNILTLSFDTLDIDKAKAQAYSIIEPKIDSLVINVIDSKAFEIEYLLPNKSTYIERYRKR